MVQLNSTQWRGIGDAAFMYHLPKSQLLNKFYTQSFFVILLSSIHPAYPYKSHMNCKLLVEWNYVLIYKDEIIEKLFSSDLNNTVEAMIAAPLILLAALARRIQI